MLRRPLRVSHRVTSPHLHHIRCTRLQGIKLILGSRYVVKASEVCLRRPLNPHIVIHRSRGCTPTKDYGLRLSDRSQAPRNRRKRPNDVCGAGSPGGLSNGRIRSDTHIIAAPSSQGLNRVHRSRHATDRRTPKCISRNLKLHDIR